MAKRRANGEGNIRKRKDGRWEGRYTAGHDPITGKPIIKNVLAKTQAQAKEKLKAAIEQCKGLDVAKGQKYTVGQWMDVWYEYYAQIKQEKEKAAQQARKEAQFIIDDARRAADAVYEELKQLRKQAQSGAFVPGSNERQAELRRNLNAAEQRLQPQKQEKARPEATRAIRVGDTVELLKLGTKATVLAINKDGSYQLRAGIMQVTAKPDEVYLLENETQNAAKKVIAGKVRELKAAAQPELDIRGMAVDEALPVLDNFLDSAYMGNLPTARIIHGKGTGVLRAAVHDELRRCKYVKSFRLGVYGEGESGVTIVEFK